MQVKFTNHPYFDLLKILHLCFSFSYFLINANTKTVANYCVSIGGILQNILLSNLVYIFLTFNALSVVTVWVLSE